MRRENKLHTSVITTAQDSRDMKAHLACLKSGPSEPHVPSVEGKQLTTGSSRTISNIKLSNILQRVPDLTIAGMFSGGEAFWR